MRQLLPFIVGFFLVAFVHPDANADDYKLLKGKGKSVCELCKKNLETIDTVSLRCERPFNKKFPQIQPVAWKKLDVMAHKELVKKIERYHAYDDQEAKGQGFRGKTEEEFEKSIRDDIRLGLLGLSTTDVDVDNDGQVDHVLRYESGSCGITNGSSHSIYVLNSDQRALDIDKSKRAFGAFSGTSLGIFRYRGRVYADSWIELETTWRIYRLPGTADELCILNRLRLKQ